MGLGILVALLCLAVGGTIAEPNLAPAPASVSSPKAKGPSEVEVVHPRHVTVAIRLNTNATLEAFEDAALFAKVSGYLSEVRVDIGDHVKAGQVLAVIDVPEMENDLAVAQAQLEANQKALETAQRQVDHDTANLALQDATFKRQATLNRDRWVSDQALDESRAQKDVAQADLGFGEASRDEAAAQVELAAATVAKLKTLLAYREIRAPFDGVVSQRLVNRGDLVQAPTATRTTPLFTVQRIDTVRVFCDVPENQVPYVRVGDHASVKPLGLDGGPITGTITRFAFRLDPQTRNMRTEIDLPNPDERLYPGMYANVSLEMDRRPNALTVPDTAIDSDGSGYFVWTVTNDNRIARLPIRIGLTDSGRAEVIDGLSEKTPVVAVAKSAPPPGTAVQSTASTSRAGNGSAS
jgi:multidrug efflux pump subunit AcrA (membrane-fusion protein)